MVEHADNQDVSQEVVDVSRETTEASEPESLWDVSQVTEEDQREELHIEVKQPEPEIEEKPEPWFLSEGLEGVGEAPEWFKKDKYKSVAEQAKAYVDLEKKFGETKGAPKDGYDLSSFEETGINAEDPFVKHFSETFKELNLTQEGFNRVIQEFYEVQKHMVDASTADEMKKLGNDAKQIVTKVDTWINNTFDENTAAVIKSWVSTAEDMKALQAIQAFQPKSEIPLGNSVNYTPFETYDDVKNEKVTNWQRYQNDEGYRNALSKRLQEAYIRENQGRRQA